MSRAAWAPNGAPAEDQIARLRLTSRLAVAYFLDAVAIARGEGNVLDTLLAGAIIQANVQEINRRADLQVAFAETDEIPSDEMRRPVSMNALATSLDLPFETVRRRIQAMVRDGFCKIVDGGVIVPTAVLASPKYYADGFRSYERLRAFYYQLADLDLLRDLPPASVALSANTFPIRAVARLAGGYVLRVVENLGAIGDVMDGLIVLEIFRCNVELLPSELRGGEGFAPTDMVSDSLRRPIAAMNLAGRLGLPQETVRRHVSGLMARGLCVRMRGGLIVPAHAMVQPELQAALAANAGNLQRLFAALSQLGVLQVWDSIRQSA